MCRLVETHRNNTVNFIYIAPLKAEFTKSTQARDKTKLRLKNVTGGRQRW